MAEGTKGHRDIGTKGLRDRAAGRFSAGGGQGLLRAALRQWGAGENRYPVPGIPHRDSGKRLGEKPNDAKRKRIARLVRKGMPVAEIAKREGKSRQAIHQIVARMP